MKFLIPLLVFHLPVIVFSQNGWQLQTTPMLTSWTKEVVPENPLPEYPRPQMRREVWQNLNGLWDYSITDSSIGSMPVPQGKILVPYPLESALSGVNKALQPQQKLWYRRKLELKKKEKGQLYLLHFGAVDFDAELWINGQRMGQHRGGYQEFSFDITKALKKGDNDILIAVKDPTDAGNNPKGKQALKPSGIMYTAVSGIWQTVWLETVPAVHITALRITPNVDAGKLNLSVIVNDPTGEYSIEASSSSTAKIRGRHNTSLTLDIPHVHLWSPDDPYLYDLSVKLLDKGIVVDSVSSYFGMRKVEIKKDSLGQERIFLNDRYTFNLGVLDQGYWPDGIYTAPTDVALEWDIRTIKQMGFNTIRKHIKIETARWYYHCDRLGMLVWQDMPYPANLSPGAKKEFELENEANVRQLYNYPCIVTWVIFNEGWNKYDQERVTHSIKNLDSTRLVNGHSGENYDKTSPLVLEEKWVKSDLTDIHDYPGPNIAPYIKGKARVLGEWGGVRVTTLGHQWNIKQGWGYIETNATEFERKYHLMIKHLKVYEEEGLSGAIYTQPFDVEIEENGLITYDRHYFKIPLANIARINSEMLGIVTTNKVGH